MDKKPRICDISSGAAVDTAGLTFPYHVSQDTNSLRHTNTNPFRQQHVASINTLPGIASQGIELSVNGALRKATPARAVFKDLTTAYSSITSGAARSTRSGPSSTYDLSEIEDENSIPLKTLDTDTYKVGFMSDLPIPPPPVALVDRETTHPLDRKLNRRGFAYEQYKEDPPTQNSQQGSKLLKALKPFNKIEFYPVANPENWPFRESGGRKNKKAPAKQQASGERPDIYYPGRNEGQVESLSFDSQELLENKLPRTDRHEPQNRLRPFNEIMQSQDILNTCAGSNPESQQKQLPMPSPVFPPFCNHHSSSHESTLPEVDTIGDIVKCYAGSNDGLSEPELPPLVQHNGNNDYLSSGESSSAYMRIRQPSAREVRKHEREQRAAKLQKYNLPPQSSLPQGPSFAFQRPVPSSSQAMATSPSYGDTNDLLDFSHQRSPIVQQPALWTVPKSIAIPRSDALTDLRSEADDLQQTNIDPFDSDRDPHIVVTEASEDINQQSNHHKRDHRDLERDISKALRRASNNSCYSDGSFDSHVQQHVNQGKNTTNAISVGELQRLKVGESFPSRPATVESYVPDNSFYNSAAVASNWISKDDQREVRIPITRNSSTQRAAPPSSLPCSRPGLTSSSRRGDAVISEGDWETEVTSEAEFIGGMVNRVGSSIANYSDSDAASSSIQEVDEFGSRERILQHPADNKNTQYAGYRMKNLKDTNQPIILPSHQNHNTNGYLANSYRTMPYASHLNYNPTPMPNPHRHPFNSTPPDIMEPTIQNTIHDARRGYADREANLYKSSPLTFHTTMVSDITEASNESPYLSRPAAIVEGSKNNSIWEDASIQTDSQREVARRNRKEVTSFGLVSDLAQGKHVEGYNPDGTRVTEPEGARHKSHEALGARYEYRTDGHINESRAIQAGHEPRKNRFAKRPPGGLLRDIQARANAKLHSNSDHRVSKKKDFDRPHSIPDGMETLGFTGNENSQVFTYTPPTAPPRRGSTLALYHPDQFSNDPTHVLTQEELEARHAAKSRQSETRRNPSIGQPLQPSDGLLGRSSNDEGHQRQIAGYPRLINDEEASTTDTLHAQKQKFGWVILILCNLFFPLLLLYGFGHLDFFMLWYTKGEAAKFNKGQKRLATFLGGLWLILVVLGMIVGVTYAIARHYGNQ